MLSADLMLSGSVCQISVATENAPVPAVVLILGTASTGKCVKTILHTSINSLNCIHLYN